MKESQYTDKYFIRDGIQIAMIVDEVARDYARCSASDAVKASYDAARQSASAVL